MQNCAPAQNPLLTQRLLAYCLPLRLPEFTGPSLVGLGVFAYAVPSTENALPLRFFVCNLASAYAAFKAHSNGTSSRKPPLSSPPPRYQRLLHLLLSHLCPWSGTVTLISSPISSSLGPRAWHGVRHRLGHLSEVNKKPEKSGLRTQSLAHNS